MFMYSITYVPGRQRLIWRKFYSIAHPIFEPYKLLKILICVTFYFYGNPSLNCVSFFKSKCTSIYCKNSFFACAKTSRKVFAKILSVSLHSFIFVPWLLLLTFVGSSLTFSLDREKGIQFFYYLIISRKKQ